MNEDNKTIAANICREHAKNYGGPSTPAITMSAIVSELDKRDREIAALKARLGEVEKAIETVLKWSSDCYCLSDEETATAGGMTCPRCLANEILSSLRTPSDGEGDRK